MLILPPTNHCACGGSHFNTVSHSLNQCNSPAAKRAQNSSGLALASARNASSSAIDLICACSANALEGGKTRASCCSDSMLVVADDMVPRFAGIIPAPLADGHYQPVFSSATISRSAARAASTSSGAKEMAPTTACPPPP